MKTLLIEGMHGMGDCLHQRAIIRRLLPAYDRIYLETSWPCIYHDLPVRLIYKSSRLRTQAKNAAREHSKFTSLRPLARPGVSNIKVWYRPADVRASRSVLRAMALNCGVKDDPLDFRLPIPAEWTEQAKRQLGSEIWNAPRPILFFRPLVSRTEWGGCSARNPDFMAYRSLFDSIRERFFVVGIADTIPGVEWIEGGPYQADATFYNGELPFEVLAALARRSAMILCSPGFAAVLGQSVETPVACVFGGYERAHSFSAGEAFAPYLGIEPSNPCECFRHDHNCSKSIHTTAALLQLERFSAQASARHHRD